MSQFRKMPYVRLGSSGLKVSKIVLGCTSFGTPQWIPWVLPEDECIKIIKTAYDAGINAFDTANTYSNGESEVILGKAIKQLNLPRDEIVVMTKVYGVVCRSLSEVVWGKPNTDELGYVNQCGLSRKHIFDSVKHSLERLQLGYIDLLQCHRFDYNTPIEETMQALHDVVKAGYVRYIGMSSCWAWQFHAMQHYAIANNLTPFISMQNHYNLAYREEEREMIPTLKHFGVGSIPYSPLASGILARPPNEDEKSTRGKTTGGRMYSNEVATKDIISAVEKVAKAKRISMAQVSIAWLMSKPGVSAPIIGVTSQDKLLDLIGAIDVKLTDEEVKELEAPYSPQLVFGHA